MITTLELTKIPTMRNLINHPNLTYDDEIKYLRAYQEHKDNNAAQHIILAYMKLVFKLAQERYNRFSVKALNARIELSDLVIEGCLGLYRALETFTLDKCVRFGSYARDWILSSIRQALTAASSDFNCGRCSKQFKKVFSKNGELLSGEDVQDTLAQRYLCELDLTENNSTLDVADVVITEQDNHIRNQHLMAAINGLTPKEQYVIKRSFFAEEHTTLSSIGAELGVSLQRVDQIKKAAMRKLKHKLEEQNNGL